MGGLGTHLAAWGHGEGAGGERLTGGWMVRHIGYKVYVERAQDADAWEARVVAGRHNLLRYLMFGW